MLCFAYWVCESHIAWGAYDPQISHTLQQHGHPFSSSYAEKAFHRMVLMSTVFAGIPTLDATH
jgi:hypothetical protein